MSGVYFWNRNCVSHVSCATTYMGVRGHVHKMSALGGGRGVPQKQTTGEGGGCQKIHFAGTPHRAGDKQTQLLWTEITSKCCLNLAPAKRCFLSSDRISLGHHIISHLQLSDFICQRYTTGQVATWSGPFAFVKESVKGLQLSVPEVIRLPCKSNSHSRLLTISLCS